MTRRRKVVALALMALLLVTGCTQSTDRRLVDGYFEEIGEQPFYTLPTPLPAGKPGEIVRTERLSSAPDRTIAWRVLYHTTDVTGADIVVSGVVIAPTAPARAGGRVVVGWGHPTTGAAAKCAPSNGIDPFDLIEGMSELLNAGYVVAAADYPGMGVAGPNSYLIGTSEGNSVLDAVRAARNLPETGVGPNTDVLLWGHSQGGQAVLFAGQAAPSYAPELQVRGVAVAAPAADLGTLLDDDIPDASGVTLGSYAFAAYQSVYAATTPGLSLDQILTPEGVAGTPGMAQLCLLGQHAELQAQADALVGHYLRSDPAVTEPWSTLLAQNTPGPAALTMPLYVAQGDADTLVLPAATKQFVAQQCAAGGHVTFALYPGDTHGSIALKAMPAVLSFFTGVLQATPPASTC
jgi:alpha-beta hydrolase superfamily lysophospholipase